MQIFSIQGLLSIGVVVFALGAAFGWYRAASAVVRAVGEAENTPFQAVLGDGDSSPLSLSYKGLDVLGTISLQIWWNKFAAVSACVAAVFQAVLTASTWHL